MAALARLQREDPISNEDLEQAQQHLIQSWKDFTIVEVSQPFVETAGRFADVFALLGYDRRLNQAAQIFQLEVLS